MATTRTWGIITNLEGLQAGLCVNSLSFNDTASVAEALDEHGRCTDLAAYSKRTTVSITGVLDSAKGELAKAGNKITISGKDYIIDSVNKNESNTAFCEVTISAQTADNAIITVIGDEE